MKVSIAILLSTYNGAPFLSAQLDSILAQSNTDWHLLVRDDCSGDSTLSVLAAFQSRFPVRITILPSGQQRLGAAGSFAELMAAADADYFMFCDQDDVWLPGKIDACISKMKELELEFAASTPLLVHTDLKVVDEELLPLADSLWNYQNSDPVAGISLNRLLVQNPVTGCTVMINRQLRDLALPLPAQAVMHDWWLALVCSAFGVVGHVATQTALYRQHAANDTGAREWGVSYAMSQLRARKEQRVVMERLYRQAGAFLDIYRDRLSSCQREMLEVYVRLDSLNSFLRRWYILRYRFFYAGVVRNMGRMIIG